MKTRLQVEHPVTEMITGLDLVEWQLRVASGEVLPLKEGEARANGHAIEARIYAEDTDKGFLPSIGVIRHWREPAGEGIRVDTGFRRDDAVTPYYDALLAKLIVWAPDRPQAIERMVHALHGFEIAGVTTNLGFLQVLLEHPQVARGDIDVGFIEREISALTAQAAPMRAIDMAAACTAVILHEQEEQGAQRDDSPWSRTDGWTLAGRRSRRLSFRQDTHRYDAILWYGRDGLSMEFEGITVPLRWSEREPQSFEVILGDASERATATWSGRDLDLVTPHGRFALAWLDPFAADMREAAAGSRIVAPMPGTVTRILAQPGTDLPRGAPLLVLEAMKMEHTLRAPADGRLTALKCAVGDFVQEGAELAEFEPADTSP
jgi:3-methylcrotonyl-CoA carboxylase alpha subunit